MGISGIADVFRYSLSIIGANQDLAHSCYELTSLIAGQSHGNPHCVRVFQEFGFVYRERALNN